MMSISSVATPGCDVAAARRRRTLLGWLSLAALLAACGQSNGAGADPDAATGDDTALTADGAGGADAGQDGGTQDTAQGDADGDVDAATSAEASPGDDGATLDAVPGDDAA